MEPIRIESVVRPNGRIIIEGLPFEEGEIVEVVVSENRGSKTVADNPYPLRGTPFRYDDPFESVISLDDWKFLK